jgi:hypothetical protein
MTHLSLHFPERFLWRHQTSIDRVRIRGRLDFRAKSAGRNVMFSRATPMSASQVIDVVRFLFHGRR